MPWVNWCGSWTRSSGMRWNCFGWYRTKSGICWVPSRKEVAAGDVPRLDDLTELKTLVMDAEATVLARLTNSGTER